MSARPVSALAGAMVRVVALMLAAAASTWATACAQGAQSVQRVPAGLGRAADSVTADSVRKASRSGLPPAGFGTLHQSDIALAIQNFGVTISAIPLDESVLRALAPDSYQSLHDLRDSKSKRLMEIQTRLGLTSVQAWYVTFFNVDLGEARYDAGDFLLRSAGRDFRPIDILGLKPGWGDGRLAQKGVQSAIYVFDPAVDLTQPITMSAAGQQTSNWSDNLQRIERERALAWSRASAATATKKP